MNEKFYRKDQQKGYRRPDPRNQFRPGPKGRPRNQYYRRDHRGRSHHRPAHRGS